MSIESNLKRIADALEQIARGSAPDAATAFATHWKAPPAAAVAASAAVLAEEAPAPEAPAPEAPAPAAPAPTPAPAPAAPTTSAAMTPEELNAALQQEAMRIGDQGARIFGELKARGATKIDELDPAEYGPLLDAVRAVTV